MPLEAAVGNYCAYCERPYPEDVEHLLPRAEFPALAQTWDNLLLACKSCNDTKSNRQLVRLPPDAARERAHRLWPDRDNTARAFVYSRRGVEVASGLDPAQRELAVATMSLTGFHCTPESWAPPTSVRDRRWRSRDEVWELAPQCREKLRAAPGNLALRDAIAQLAGAKGFWSVWRAVFLDDADMLRRINVVFVGTADDCFDAATGALRARPGGLL